MDVTSCVAAPHPQGLQGAREVLGLHSGSLPRPGERRLQRRSALLGGDLRGREGLDAGGAHVQFSRHRRDGGLPLRNRSAGLLRRRLQAGRVILEYRVDVALDLWAVSAP